MHLTPILDQESERVHAYEQGAAEHDRLGSNTYRRLNLGLAAWAALNAALLLDESAAAPVKWCFACVSPGSRLHNCLSWLLLKLLACDAQKGHPQVLKAQQHVESMIMLPELFTISLLPSGLKAAGL